MNFVGFPRISWEGEHEGQRVLVMSLLGPSLEDLLNYAGRRFAPRTVFAAALQVLHRIEAVHRAGFVHGDIKPENVLIGVADLFEPQQTLHLIDFGLARPMTEPLHEARQGCAEATDSGAVRGCGARRASASGAIGFAGNLRFASADALRHQPACARDDLESLGYVMVYLLRGGTLPWEGKEKVLATMAAEGDIVWWQQ